MYTYIHTYIYAYVHMYMHTHINIYIYIYTRIAHIYIYIYIYIYMYTHTCMRASPVSARRGAPCFFKCVKGGTRLASKLLPPPEGLSCTLLPTRGWRCSLYYPEPCARLTSPPMRTFGPSVLWARAVGLHQTRHPARPRSPRCLSVLQTPKCCRRRWQQPDRARIRG